MQKHSILTAAIFLLLSALLPTALMGQAADHKEPAPQLVIRSAEADYASGQMIITGVNLAALVDVSLRDHRQARRRNAVDGLAILQEADHVVDGHTRALHARATATHVRGPHDVSIRRAYTDLVRSSKPRATFRPS